MHAFYTGPNGDILYLVKLRPFVLFGSETTGLSEDAGYKVLQHAASTVTFLSHLILLP